MSDIRRLRAQAGLSQRELAEAAGTSQPTVAAYERGRKSPTLRTLRRLARAAGFEARIEFHPPLTREECRSLALHRAIADRLSQDPESVLERAHRNLATMRKANPDAEPLLREWEVLLARPLSDLLPLLTDHSPRARELRQVTPFAGVLSAVERADVYRAFGRKKRERS
jgi:transcriptional regulator with XRE-family HTH domain